MTVNSQNSLILRRGGKVVAEDQQGNKDPRLAAIKKPVGLVNLGNTCFMNAALQCLSRTLGLQDKLELLGSNPVVTFNGSSLDYNEDGEGSSKRELKLQLEVPSDALVRKMLQLLKNMTEGTHTVNPRAVHCVMAKVFGAGLQHDSHELLRHVLDKLKKDQIRAFRIALMDMFGIPREEASKMHQSNPKKAVEVKEWDRKLYHITVIDELFGGELVTTRTCLECKTIKTSREEFLDLSLPIRVVRSGGDSKTNNISINNRYSLANETTTINRTLFECLRCFTEAETLSGNNNVDCEKCHEMKLALVKSGRPIEEVFPQPPPPVARVEQKINKAIAKKYVKTRKSSQSEEVNENAKIDKPQKERRRRKRKTRAEKVAEDQARGDSKVEQPENVIAEDAKKSEGEIVPEPPSGSSRENSDADQDKAADEGYAEDFKETDDSSGVSARSSGADNDGDRDDLVVNDEKDGAEGDESESADENDEPALKPKPVIPKSTKSPCSRQTMVLRPPRVLTIHLKRFTVGARGYTCKLSDHVKFEEYIDIRDYVKTDLPSYDDEDSSNGPVSPGSWSFDELNGKEQDVLGGASGDDGHSFTLGPIPLRLKSDCEPGPSRLITTVIDNSTSETLYDDKNEQKGPDSICDSVLCIPKKFDGSGASPMEEGPEQDPSALKESKVLFEFDGGEKNLETKESKLSPDVSPITCSKAQLNEVELKLKDCGINEVGQPPIEACPVDLEDIDDEPPPYPGSPVFDDDDGISTGRSDVCLPGELVSKCSDLGSEAVKRWDPSANFTAEYDKDIEASAADVFEDLNAKRCGNSLVLDDAETLRAPVESCTTYNEDSRDRLPLYQDVIPSVDESNNTVWGTNVANTEDRSSKQNEKDSSHMCYPVQVDSKEPQAILSFENNFEPPIPSPFEPIALGYEPLNTSSIPVVVQDYEDTSVKPQEDYDQEDETLLMNEEVEENEVPTDPNGINYRLYGIVEHGGSLNWGHYVAYIRVGSDWYYISDSSVSSSNISTVLSRDPYILFYERV